MKKERLYKWIIISILMIPIAIILIFFRPKEIEIIEVDNNVENELDIEVDNKNLEEIDIIEEPDVLVEGYDEYTEKVLKTDDVLGLVDAIKEAYGSSYKKESMEEMSSSDLEFVLGVTGHLYDEMYGEVSLNKNDLDMLYVFKINDENKDELVKSLLDYQQNMIDNYYLNEMNDEYFTKLSYTRLTIIDEYCLFYCLGNYKTTLTDETERQAYFELQSGIGLDAVIDSLNK